MSNLSVATWRTWKNAPTDPPDAVVQAAIDASEEAINDRCGRVFAVAGSASARTFVPESGRSSLIEIEDCTTVTLVTNNGTTVDASAYQLEPVNGRDYAGVSVPYSRIRLLGSYWTRTYEGEASVSVTGTWGWAALPARYLEAVKIVAADVLDAKDVRNGVIGFSDYAAIRVRDNGQVAALLQRLTRARAGGPV
jgi:hypothetical protein